MTRITQTRSDMPAPLAGNPAGCTRLTIDRPNDTAEVTVGFLLIASALLGVLGAFLKLWS